MEEKYYSGKPWELKSTIVQTQLILNSFEKWTGTSFCSRENTIREQARVLFFSPYIVASHGCTADPVFNYCNLNALHLWQADWDSFIGMPSRQSAEPVHRRERETMLKRVTQYGFVDDYNGIRITCLGRRFEIKRAIIWNLMGIDGKYHGQAVRFTEWQNL